ncbi:MAG: flagellar export chaperone FliS [Pseudomonadota bacterium]|nr:MAG: flagellar export chaperone FliS [Pseudomonadota bacterium]
MLEIAANRYKQVQATMSSPGQILMALYDGLFRFLRGARLCIERREVTRARELLSRAHAVLFELEMALDHRVAPELCANLHALYDFSLDRVQVARISAKVEPIDEIIRVLTPLHEAFAIAVAETTKRPATGTTGR